MTDIKPIKIRIPSIKIKSPIISDDSIPEKENIREVSDKTIVNPVNITPNPSIKIKIKSPASSSSSFTSNGKAPIVNQKLKMVDLFAGTGGFSLAFEATNKFETIFANDFEKDSKNIYDLNFKKKLLLKDIHDIKDDEIPRMDIITSGFPCQPVSIAGKQLGFNDPRSNVIWKLIEIIKFHNPRVILLENVKNLVSHDNGNTFKVITSELENLKYHIKYKVINVCDVTEIPQNRERIYIAGFKNKSDHDRFTFPENITSPNKNISELLVPSEQVDSKYYYTDKLKCYNIVKEGVVKHISTNTVYQLRRNHIRENKSNVCPTLVATGGTGGHNVPLILTDNGIRKLTPRECMRFQGFPDNYKISGMSDSSLYQLAGNAINCKVIELIARKLIVALEI